MAQYWSYNKPTLLLIRSCFVLMLVVFCWPLCCVLLVAVFSLASSSPAQPSPAQPAQPSSVCRLTAVSCPGSSSQGKQSLRWAEWVIPQLVDRSCLTTTFLWPPDGCDNIRLRMTFLQSHRILLGSVLVYPQQTPPPKIPKILLNLIKILWCV